MKQYRIQLTEETAAFYGKIARRAGRSAGQVWPDTRFKLGVDWRWRRFTKRDKGGPPLRRGTS